jgi:hypothetical protein
MNNLSLSGMLSAILHRLNLIIPIMNGPKEPNQKDNTDCIPNHYDPYPHNAPFLKPL